MSRPFLVRLPLESAYKRRSLCAVELLDAVTLARVSQGVKVVADGFPDKGKPIVNLGGLFVWLKGDLAALRSISIDPQVLPYEEVEIPAGDPRLPAPGRLLTTIELPPGPAYPFAAGITGLRGRLVEEAAPQPPVPVKKAEVRLRWLDDDGVTWRDAPTISHTSDDGDFVAVIRFAPSELPRLDAGGALTVRLWVRREPEERQSLDLNLPQGRVADPSTSNPRIFAWEDLQP